MQFKTIHIIQVERNARGQGNVRISPELAFFSETVRDIRVGSDELQ